MRISVSAERHSVADRTGAGRVLRSRVRREGPRSQRLLSVISVCHRRTRNHLFRQRVVRRLPDGHAHLPQTHSDRTTSLLTLTEGGFGLDTEMTARLLRCGIRPLEVPVSYHGRSVSEGKKITWRDGVACLAVMARVRVQHRPEIAPVVGRIAVVGAAQGDPPRRVLHLPKAVG